ncbi:unnamed protein product [Rhizophagus irregularis]|nr:unnamed protein product [Rhizophagus irregularis]
MNFWNILIDEINDFVINRGRWKASISFEKREDEEYYKFANDILTQRKQVIDYSNETESAFAEWIKLKNELIFKESNPQKSWSSMAEKIIYPHHERHDESESEVIKQAVASYNERLKVLLAEIDEALKNYQRAPKFVELIGEWV